MAITPPKMVQFFIRKKGLIAENGHYPVRIRLGATLLEGRLYWRLYGIWISLISLKLGGRGSLFLIGYG